MRNILSMLATGATIGAALVLAATFSPNVGDVESVGEPNGQIAECESEDSAGPCYWDAATRGNGLGESFMVNADQTVIYQN